MALADLQGQWQNWTKYAVAKKLVDLSADTLKMILCSGTVPTTPDGALVLANVVQFTGANYVEKTLAGKAVTQEDGSDLMKFTADPVVWTALGAATPALSFVAIYDDATIDAHVKPILFVWANATQPNGQSYTINPNASGFATLT